MKTFCLTKKTSKTISITAIAIVLIASAIHKTPHYIKNYRKIMNSTYERELFECKKYVKEISLIGGIASELSMYIPLIFLKNAPHMHLYNYAFALLSNMSTIRILKMIVTKERPDGSNNKSFPSGHVGKVATHTFQLGKMYHTKGYIASGVILLFVSWSRLLCNKHDIIDILGSIFISFILTIYGLKIANYLLQKIFKIKITQID